VINRSISEPRAPLGSARDPRGPEPVEGQASGPWKTERRIDRIAERAWLGARPLLRALWNTPCRSAHGGPFWRAAATSPQRP